MRIAVWHNLPSGGGKRALYYHVRGLVERGHTVEAWCPPTADASYLPLRDLIPEHVLPFDWTPPAGQGPIGRLLTQYRETTRRLAAMDRHCRACAEEINRGGYDVLFANACMFFRTTSIGRHTRIPSVLYLPEPFRWLYEALPQLPWLALPCPKGGEWSWRYWRRFIHNLVDVQACRIQAREELDSARGFGTILVNSWFSRESVIRAYGLNARVCELGVDTTLFVEQGRPRERFVAGLGAIVPAKRVELAVDAVARLPQPRPDLVWIANVAPPGYLEEVMERARSCSVKFRPEIAISDKEVVDLLNRATLLVYAPRLEPFGLAPLEANACGLPVVAVAEGGVRETVRNGVNGLLVDDDPAAIAGAIERLLADPSYASRLGSAGAELVRREWSLPASIDRLEARLAEAVNRPPG